MASPQLQAIVQMLRSGPPLAELSIEEQRATFGALTSRFKLAEDVRCQWVNPGGVPAEWITTPEAADERVIYYLHGGGYTLGSINTHREMISRISRAARARALRHRLPAGARESLPRRSGRLHGRLPLAALHRGGSCPAGDRR